MKEIFDKVIKKDEDFVIEYLRKHPEHLNDTCINDMHLIHYAAIYNLHKLMEFLLENRVDINLTTFGGKWSPLMIATLNGHTDMIDFLLLKGAEPLMTNHNGKMCIDLINVRKQVDVLFIFEKHFDIFDKDFQKKIKRKRLELLFQ